jgi:hypothetical protein
MEKIMTDIDNARTLKRAEADQYIDRLYDQFSKDIRRWALETADQTFLNRIALGPISGRALLCNQHVRQTAQYALIDAMLENFSDDPKRRRYFVTLAWDLGVTMEREPRLNLVALRNVANHYLRRSGLDGVGVVEIDVWKNLTGEKGRRIVAQIHFVGWPRIPEDFIWRDVEKELQQKPAIHNSLGAPSVVIKPVRPTAADAAHLGMYMLKGPSSAKNPVPRPGRMKLWAAELPAGSAARLIEVLSHIEVGDVLFGIGSGTKLSRAVHRAVQRAIKPGPGRMPALRHEMIIQHWRRIRFVNGSRKFREPEIIIRSAPHKSDED